MTDIIIILLLLLYIKGKLFAMDIYDTLDYECKLICDAMYAQTKLGLLRDIHDRGVHMLLSNYVHKVDNDLLNDYVTIVEEKYKLCRTILLNQAQTINSAYLN
jgi:hypothetical protein